jgi:hypothetical protein
MLLGIVVRFVEIEWHGGHSAARCFTLKLLETYVVLINLRPGGPLGEKWRIIGWVERGVRCGKSAPTRL